MRSNVAAVLVGLAATMAGCGTRRAIAPPAAPPAAAVDPIRAPGESAADAAALEPRPPVESPLATAEPSGADAVAGCPLIAGAGEPVTTVAVTDRIDPAHAPYPANEGERLLFRQLYDTLVRVDCNGRISPALAASWRLEADGRTWHVTLRDNARFSDGTPVTAAAVRESWASDDNASDLNRAARRILTSAVVVDDRTLSVTLRNAGPGDPLALADTDLAVARRSPGSRWPLGTLGADTPRAAAGVSVAERVFTLARHDRPPLRILMAPRDPRDLLGTGIDLLLTRDPATLAYAATLPQFQVVPLEWQRLQAVLLPAPPPPRELPVTDEGRQRFVQDAIRGDARGASPPFWWTAADACQGTPARVEAPSSISPRIVYDGSDTAARDVAERLVAVAGANYQRAAALVGASLQQALGRGADAGYVVSLQRRPLDPCRELAFLMETAPWLDRQTIVPISETRLHAIVRRGTAHISAEWDGGLALAPPTERAHP